MSTTCIASPLGGKVLADASAKRLSISDADTAAGDDGSEMVRINLHLSEGFLEDTDRLGTNRVPE
ncbi:hypothetical protein [Haloarcula pellucida]|uniref:hypothetical protein n=1 Tax=Haloarcula pellucida TaxID=1427151 RepID=UPI001E3EE717|nr:hypothetical protein [Halomicroarcula pellucida]